MQPKTLLLVATFLFSSAISPAQTNSREPNQYRDLMGEHARLTGFRGAVLVAKDNQILFKGSTGLANEEFSARNRPTTRFRIGSITKTFTAALILRLAHNGKIDLDAPLSKYLPYYRKDTGAKIKIRHLLSNSSGLGNFEGDGNLEVAMRRPFAVTDFVKSWCSSDPLFEPGKEFRYSNAGFFILGAVIESITGKKYDAHLRTVILDPLGMKNTGMDYNQAIIKNRATGYEFVSGVKVKGEFIDSSIPFSAGGLYSTVEDLHIWSRSFTDNLIISQASKTESFQEQAGKYGFGWFNNSILKADNTRARGVGHAGSIKGFSAILLQFEEAGLHVIVLSNLAGRRSRDLGWALARRFFDLPVQEYTPDKKREFWQAIQREDHFAAKEMLGGLEKDTHGQKIDPIPNAKTLIAAGLFKEAAALLRFHLVIDSESQAAKNILATISGATTRPPQFVELNKQFSGPDYWSESVHALDVNHDGRLDLIFSNCNGWRKPGDMSAPSSEPLRPTILMNMGTKNDRPMFADKSESLFPEGFKVHAKNLAVCDIDNDGRDDLVFAIAFGAQQRLLRFDPKANRFVDETKERLPELIINSNGVGWGDLDDDGDIDLVFVDSGPKSDFAPGGKARLLLNDGKGYFTDVSQRLHAANKIGAQNAKLIDIDGDLDLDIVVDGKSTVTQLYLNDGKANFTLTPNIIPEAEKRGQPYEIEWADLDNDGDLDAVHMSWGGSRRQVYRNVVLKNNLAESGELSFTVIKDALDGRNNEDENEFAFFDANHDGFLDLVVATLIAGAKADEKLFINSGKIGTGFLKQQDGAFSMLTDGTLDLTIADFDGDGRHDVVTAQGESKSRSGFENRFYKNMGPADHQKPRLVRSTVDTKSDPRHKNVIIRAEWLDATRDDGESHLIAEIVWSITVNRKKSAPKKTSMPHIGGNIFRAELLSLPQGATLEYTLYAKDRAGNKTASFKTKQL